MWKKAVAELGAKLDRIAEAVERNADAREKQLDVARLSMSMALTSLRIQLRAGPFGTWSLFNTVFDKAGELGVLLDMEPEPPKTEEPTIIAGA